MNKKKSLITITLAATIIAGCGITSSAALTKESSVSLSDLASSTSTSASRTWTAGTAKSILNLSLNERMPEEFEVGDLASMKSVKCLDEKVRMPGEGNGSYVTTIGGYTYRVGKGETKRFQVDQKLSGTGKSETPNKYHETRTETVGKTSDTASIAYICTFATEESGIYTTDQIAIWSNDYAVKKSRPKNDLALEADEYQKFFEEWEKIKQENNGKEITDTVIDATVATDIPNREQWLGPFEVNYARGITKQGTRDVVDFGGITEMKLFSEDGKEISQDAWEFVPQSVKDGQQRNIQEIDKNYQFPLPKEKFYIKLYVDKLNGAKKISKIQYNYERLYCEAQIVFYEGTYDEITWAGKVEQVFCSGGHRILVGRNPDGSPRWFDQPCQHGSMKPHYFDGRYYIEQVGRETKSSQPPIRITTIKKERIPTTYEIPTTAPSAVLNIPYLHGGGIYYPPEPPEPPVTPTPPPTPTPTPPPEDDLTFTIAGMVWEDTKTGKESDYDGQKGTANAGTPEAGMKNVEVRAYKHGTSEVVASTYTDENGSYVITELPVGKYDIGFVYDGLTYTTTKAFASGSASDYKQNPNDEKYILNSKAEESPTERQAFNDKFYEITANGSNYQSGISAVAASPDAISYLTSNGVSKIQTTYSDGKVKQPFQLETKTTNSIDAGYPFADYVNNATTKKVIGGQEYDENFVYMAYVNLGLKRRPEVDFALTKDVYTSTVTINNKQINYKYNARAADSFDIELKNSLAYSSVKYNREVFKSDYNYKIDDYKTNNMNISGTELRGLKEEDQELKVFVTYKIKIRNQSEIYSGTINQVVDYFDSTYNLISSDLKLDIRNDDGTIEKDKVVARAPYYETISGKTGLLNVSEVQDTSSKDFKKTYISGMQNEILQSGEDVILYITFEVDKNDQTRNVLLGEKNNQVEITSYSTFDAYAVTKTNTVGMIDRDSAPGNLDPINSLSLEDDSDIAPTINIKLYEGATRTINGLVWEDQRDQNKLKAGEFSTGDGLRQESETLIDGVTVQLIEIITAADGTQYEYIWQEMSSGESGFKYVNLEGTVLDGTLGTVQAGQIDAEKGVYKFSGYIPGDYIVRFKYGDTQKTILTGRNETSYNGQDYKSTVYLQGEDINREWYDLGSEYLNNTKMSDARDNEARRLSVIDYSKVMKYSIAAVLASHEKGYTSLYDELINNTWMYADTAKMRVEVEYNTTSKNGLDSNASYNIRDIDLGLVERPKANIQLTKEIQGIRITLANGTPIIDTEAGARKNVNWVDNRGTQKGAIHIYMDQEVMQGANIQIKYKVTVTNKSEVDYIGASANSVGTAYYTGKATSADKQVTTAIDIVSDYVDNNIVYREADNTGKGWLNIDKTDLENIAKMEQTGYLDPSVKLESKNIHEILVNDSLRNDQLLPGDSRTLELLLTKGLTTTKDSKDDPTFDNIAEVLQYTNLVGRRSDIPGNQDPTKVPLEGDSDWTEKVSITPPTGENRAHYFVITGIVLTVLAGGVFIIKKRVLDK